MCLAAACILYQGQASELMPFSLSSKLKGCIITCPLAVYPCGYLDAGIAWTCIELASAIAVVLAKFMQHYM